MSREELKVAAAGLSQEDRLWLAAYLRHLNRVNSQANAKELSAINKRIDEGRFVTLDDLKRLHAELEAEGL